MDNPLLTIRLDGQVVAEATLVVHDGPGAWKAFQAAFANVAPFMVGEIFNTMRVACDPELRAEMGPQGMTIDLNTVATPQIVIPTNGHLPEMKGY